MGQEVSTFFSDVAKNFTAYVLALSVIGGVSMALLQTLKDLLPVRQWFQRYYLRKWMQEGATEAQNNLGITAPINDTEKDLLTLAVDGDEKAFYDLQIEQLCGQYTAAIQVVLESPGRYQRLFAVTASQADRADIQLVLNGPPDPPTKEFLDARNRVTHQCQRAIDALQITAGFRWKWILQLASLLLSGMLAWIALAYRTDVVALSPVSVVVSAVLAGFLAPVAKDLLAVLQKARGQ